MTLVPVYFLMGVVLVAAGLRAERPVVAAVGALVLVASIALLLAILQSQ